MIERPRTALPEFTSLSPAAAEELTCARHFVSRIVQDVVGGPPLEQSTRDLSPLQRLVSSEGMQEANAEAWFAVGIAFGDVLRSMTGTLEWCLVTDQTGTFAALKPRDKSIYISAPTLLWKRFQRGEVIDLSHLARRLLSYVEEQRSSARDR